MISNNRYGLLLFWSFFWVTRYVSILPSKYSLLFTFFQQLLQTVDIKNKSDFLLTSWNYSGYRHFVSLPWTSRLFVLSSALCLFYDRKYHINCRKWPKENKKKIGAPWTLVCTRLMKHALTCVSEVICTSIFPWFPTP